MKHQILESFIDELQKIALVGAVPKAAPPPKTPAPKPAPSARLAPTPAAKPPILANLSVPTNINQSLLNRPIPRAVKPDIQGVVTKPTKRINPIRSMTF